MSQLCDKLAVILARSDRTIASYAATELFDRDPLSAAAMPQAFVGWQTLLTSRLEDLAAAVAMEQPELFSSQIRWAKSFLASRGVPGETFRASLDALRRVLAAELSEDVAPVAEQYMAWALDGFDRELAAVPVQLSTGSDYDRLAAAYLLAVLEGDRRRARMLVLDRASLGDSVTDLYLRVLLQAQIELGRMWLAGEINVAEEHFGTTTTRLVMAQLMNYATFRPVNGKTFLGAGVTGNLHDIGLQAVGDFFEMDGWRVIHLGADMPLEDLLQAAEFYHPDVVGLSASMATHLPVLRAMIGSIRAGQNGRRTKILVGGRALEELDARQRQLDADAFGSDPLSAVAISNALVGLDGK